MYGHDHHNDATSTTTGDASVNNMVISEQEHIDYQEQATQLILQARERNQVVEENGQLVFTDLDAYNQYQAINQQVEQAQTDCAEEHIRNDNWRLNAAQQQDGIDGTEGCGTVILAGTGYEQYAIEAIKDQALNGENLDDATRLRLVDTLLRYRPSSARLTEAEITALRAIHTELGGDDAYIDSPPQGPDDEWNVLVKQVEYRIAGNQNPEHGDIDMRLNGQDLFDAEGHQLYDYSSNFRAGETLCIPSLAGLDENAFVQPSNPEPECVPPEDLESAVYSAPVVHTDNNTDNGGGNTDDGGGDTDDGGDDGGGTDDGGGDDGGGDDGGGGDDDGGDDDGGDDDGGDDDGGDDDGGDDDGGCDTDDGGDDDGGCDTDDGGDDDGGDDDGGCDTDDGGDDSGCDTDDGGGDDGGCDTDGGGDDGGGNDTGDGGDNCDTAGGNTDSNDDCD